MESGSFDCRSREQEPGTNASVGRRCHGLPPAVGCLRPIQNPTLMNLLHGSLRSIDVRATDKALTGLLIGLYMVAIPARAQSSTDSILSTRHGITVMGHR